MTMQACWGCGRATPRNYCPECRPARQRRPAAARAAGRPERGTARWREMRDVVWERDGGVCQRCRRRIADGEAWDLGHRVPHAAGGPFEQDNLRVECLPCNRGAREG